MLAVKLLLATPSDNSDDSGWGARWADCGGCGFVAAAPVVCGQDLRKRSSAPFYSSTCQAERRALCKMSVCVYVGVCVRSRCSPTTLVPLLPLAESHRGLTIMWQSCSTWREMTLLHFYIKSTDRIHF